MFGFVYYNHSYNTVQKNVYNILATKDICIIASRLFILLISLVIKSIPSYNNISIRMLYLMPFYINLQKIYTFKITELNQNTQL